jgi:hypothetical protein
MGKTGRAARTEGEEQPGEKKPSDYTLNLYHLAP